MREESPKPQASLGEIARVFLRIGATSFGGPAAHVAMLRREVVERRRWLTDERFGELLGVVNLLPGPNSTELAIHIGKDQGGAAGLAVAGLAFIAPAMAITMTLAAFCTRFAGVTTVARAVAGLQPVVVAVVAHASVGLGRSLVGTRNARTLAVGALAAALLGAHELAVLIATGIAAVALDANRTAPLSALAPVPPLPAVGGAALALSPAASSVPLAAVTPTGLFFAFSKIGSVLYGSGYVLLAFLRSELAMKLRWATDDQILDSIALGQATPGPVFSAATALGYALAGVPGAVAATAGIFLPAFALVAAADPIARSVRASPRGAAFLEGVNVASLVLMAHAAIELGAHALASPRGFLVCAASLAALLRAQVDPTWLLAAGAAAAIAWP
jgi:chromate transporter